MSKRPHLGLSVVALAVGLLGWTPLGQAASDAVAKVVPYAKVAGFAKNAGRLNGHVSSRTPSAGQIPVLNSAGKLPASIGAVGPAGPAGPPGSAGAAGVSGYQQVAQQVNVVNGTTDKTVSCPGGKSVLAGGYNLAGGNQDLTVFDTRPTSNSDWRFRITNLTGNTKTVSVTLYVVCATVGS